MIIGKSLRKIEADIDESKKARFVEGGVSEIGASLLDLVNYRNRLRYEKKLTVLGLTLRTPWPHVVSLIRNRALDGWTVDLFCLDPEFCLTDGIPQNWKWTQTVKLEQYKSTEVKNGRSFWTSTSTYIYIPTGAFLPSMASWGIKASCSGL